MNFDIEFNDLGKKGAVEATKTSLNITEDVTKPEVGVIKYIIQFPTERFVLHKVIRSQEWLPFALHPNIPDYIIQRTMVEIEKFEKEKKPEY